MTSPEEVARGLSDAQREAWSRTVLLIAASECRRWAFIAGYNDEPRCPRPATEAKLKAFRLGHHVRQLLTGGDG